MRPAGTNIVQRCSMQQDELNELRGLLDDPDHVYNKLLQQQHALRDQIKQIETQNKETANGLLKREIQALKRENERLKGRAQLSSSLVQLSQGTAALSTSPRLEQDSLLLQLQEKLTVYDRQLRDAVNGLRQLETVVRERDKLRQELDTARLDTRQIRIALELRLADAYEQISVLEGKLQTANRSRFASLFGEEQ